ncbi:MAG: hypothetical protein J0H55_03190 [Chitinophagaceae bacterium]|nr:hypothetical protein [Chitinophagaceae bacterium]
MKILVSILASCFLFISCTKTNLRDDFSSSQNLSGKVIPNVPQCGAGYHWDYYLQKCVVNCQEGYHNDSTSGSCVVDGSVQQNIFAISNPNNPDEIVGENHNSGMQQIIPNYENGQLEPTEQNVMQYTDTYILSIGYDTTIGNYAYNYDNQYFGTDFLSKNDLDSLTDQIYSLGLISLTAKNFLATLISTFRTFAGDSISIPTQSAYNSYANTLISYENQFASNPNLSSNEKTILYSVFSVARYSVVYAVNYSIQNPDTIVLNKYQTDKKSPGWFSWGRVGSGDVAGAIGGALGGAAWAMASGGTATPSIVGGAVTVGVASSVYEAGMQIFHHWGWF